MGCISVWMCKQLILNQKDSASSSIVIFLCFFFTGNPIECLNAQFKDKIKVINTYCWITSTYTIPHLQGQPVGTHVAAPGVGPYVRGEHEVQYHNYYQWVPFMLFLQVMQHAVLSHQQLHSFRSIRSIQALQNSMSPVFTKVKICQEIKLFTVLCGVTVVHILVIRFLYYIFQQSYTPFLYNDICG